MAHQEANLGAPSWYRAERMRRLTLIRHGVTAWNLQGRFQGHSDVPLDEAGRLQARRLGAQAGRLAPVDAVVCSPLLRAAETATIAFPGRTPTRDARLREVHFGVFEGGTLEENRAHPAWPWWSSDPYARPAPRGESYRALQRRAVAWLDEVRGHGRHDHVVVFSHAGTIQMLLAHLLGVERPRWEVRLEVDPTGVSQVRFEAGLALVERVNDVTHLVLEGAR